MDDPEGFVACSENNIRAGMNFLHGLWEKEINPTVIISGGSPTYLKNAIKEAHAPEGYSEALVFKEYMAERLRINPAVILETDSLNTKGNVLESLKIAKEQGCQSVVFINSRIAMPRTVTFYQTGIKQQFSDIDVKFITSESILKQGMTKEAAEKFEQDHTKLLESKAGQRTAHGELIGQIRELEGAYTRSGNY
jgi:hypothetical protein